MKKTVLTVLLLLVIPVAPQAHSAPTTVTYSLTAMGPDAPTLVWYRSVIEEIYDMATPPWSVTTQTWGAIGMRAEALTGHVVAPAYTCTVTVNGEVLARNSGHGAVICTVGY